MPHIGRVLRIIGELAAHFPNHGLMLDNRCLMLNERYVHHVFSHALQQAQSPDDVNLLNYLGPAENIVLHPEWPTYKESTGLLTGGRYGRVGRRYVTIEDGRKGGFIDFALGDYSTPEIGVEFMLKPSWSNEETVFDFMKLLDSRNSSFRQVVFLGVILRPNGLPPDAETYRTLANQAFNEAAERLGIFTEEDGRTIYFVITEVAPDGRRHHHFDEQSGQFGTTDELPPFLRDLGEVNP